MTTRVPKWLKVFIYCTLGVFALYAFLAWQESRSDAKLALMKVEFEKAQAETRKVLEALKAENEDLRAENGKQREEITELHRRDAERSQLIQTIRQLAAKQVSEVPTMDLPLVAARTAELLALPPSSIVPGQVGLTFTEPASKSNLAMLIKGDAAQKENVQLSARVVDRDSEITRLEKIIDNQEKIIANKDTEIAQNQKLFDQERQVLKQEIATEKAKGRKKGVIGAIFGFIGGLVATAFLL